MNSEKDGNVSHIDLYQASLDEYIRSRIGTIRELLKHGGEKGIRIERLLEEVIRDFLPNKYGLSSGFLIDFKGNLSRQTDIIVTDDYHHPRLFSTIMPAFHPADSVLATIEVKTSLSKGSLKQAIDNIQQTRKSIQLIHGQGYSVTPVEGGRVWVRSAKKVVPEPLGVILAYTSPKIPTLLKNIRSLCKGMTNKHRFDLLYILDKSILIGWYSRKGSKRFHRPAADRDVSFKYSPFSVPILNTKTKSDAKITPGRTFAFFMLQFYRFIDNMILPSADAIVSYFSGIYKEMSDA